MPTPARHVNGHPDQCTTTPTHYDLLCISPDATQDEIKSAYRHRIRSYHPDVAGMHGEMTATLNNAYWDLADPAKRRSHDFSIRPQVYGEPEVATEPQPEPQSGRRAGPAQPNPAPASTDPYGYDSEEMINVDKISARGHRTARITWWPLAL